MAIPPPILVIGVGNEYRHDDGVGRLVVRALQPVPDGVKVIEENGEATALMDAWSDARAVILIDAVHSGAAPGTIHRLDSVAHAVPSFLFHCSGHAFSVADAVELARILGQLPPLLTIFGIEGRDFEPGSGLSPEVAQATSEVVRNVHKEIQKFSRRHQQTARPQKERPANNGGAARIDCSFGGKANPSGG